MMFVGDGMVFFFSCLLTCMISLIIGYSWATHDSLNAIENVNRWIEDTQSNRWIQYHMYQELENKYDALLKEYEQYRGTMKAIDDCCKKRDD